MSTQVTDNEPVLILDDKKYLIENLSEMGKYLVQNLQDVGQQLQSAQMRIDQLNMAKEGLTAKLKEEVEKPQESEIVETPTEDG
tara:strand:- start:100 stop:351 length:252 start_codon:yes stop_codon:yes gene_type:complete